MKKLICIALFLLAGIFCFAQQPPYKTTGNVSDQQGNPLFGAVIKEIGVFSNATLSDINGNYVFNVSREHCTLECSYVGYVTQTKIRNGQINNFILAEDADRMEESSQQKPVERE